MVAMTDTIMSVINHPKFLLGCFDLVNIILMKIFSGMANVNSPFYKDDIKQHYLITEIVNCDTRRAEFIAWAL